jgi:hypothetical protein
MDGLRGPDAIDGRRVVPHVQMVTTAFQLTAPVTLVVDLLEWVAAGPRTYRETMEAWRTSCPKLPVWEDAVDSGFLVITPTTSGDMIVALSPRGHAFLRSPARST